MRIGYLKKVSAKQITNTFLSVFCNLKIKSGGIENSKIIEAVLIKLTPDLIKISLKGDEEFIQKDIKDQMIGYANLDDLTMLKTAIFDSWISKLGDDAFRAGGIQNSYKHMSDYAANLDQYKTVFDDIYKVSEDKYKKKFPECFIF